MGAIGRILQVIGWLWVIVSFVGPRFGFDGLNFLPGLVLIFIARIFRARARSEMPPGPGETETAPRPLTTERPRPERQQPAAPLPPPAATYTPPEPEPKLETEPKRPAQERNDLLERITLAGRETAEEPSPAEPEAVEPKLFDEGRTPMSSAEMIARARKRWDRDKS